MEETFSSLVCFQAPPLWSWFTLCSLKNPNEHGRVAGLCRPLLGGKQSWWVQAGKARKSTGARLHVCVETCGCLYTQNTVCASMYAAVCALLHTGVALFLHLKERFCAMSHGTCPHVLDGEGATSSRGCARLYLAGFHMLASCTLALRVSRFRHSRLGGCMRFHALKNHYLYRPLWAAQHMKHPFLCPSQIFECLLSY